MTACWAIKYIKDSLKYISLIPLNSNSKISTNKAEKKTNNNKKKKSPPPHFIL